MNAIVVQLIVKGAQGSLFLAVKASRGAISKHCRHCTGVNATCSCNHGCKPRLKTECSASITWKHCHHCRGTEGVECTCDQGCLARVPTGCLHHVICDRCGVHAFEGPCFTCRHKLECPDYGLCQDCYRTGEHGMHSFTRIDYPGAVPVILRAQRSSASVSTGACCGTNFVPSRASDLPTALPATAPTTPVVQGTAVVPTAVNDDPPVATTPQATVCRTVQTEASCFPPEATFSPTRVTSHPVHQVVQPSPPLPLDADMIIQAYNHFMYMTSIQSNICALCEKPEFLLIPDQDTTTPQATVCRTVETEASCFPPEATRLPTSVTSHPVHQVVQPSPPSPLDADMIIQAYMQILYLTNTQNNTCALCKKPQSSLVPDQDTTTPPATVRRSVQTEASCFPPEATVSPTSVTSHLDHPVVQPSPPLPLEADMETRSNVQFMNMASKYSE
jgi:hypothetical protein